ncbi:hypothetical protein ZWY2020_023871 [Hordeum vulgare]|nr:hypothetical protein ZWY2020_023871 [Hordeum vulgare]
MASATSSLNGFEARDPVAWLGFGGILAGVGACSSGSGCALAGDEGLEDLASTRGLGARGLDVGVGEAGGDGDEDGAGEEEAGRGGALPPGRRVLQPHHILVRPTLPSRVWKTEWDGLTYVKDMVKTD